MQKVSGHRYSLLNYVSGGLSLIVCLAYLASVFGIADPYLVLSLGISLPVALVALIQAVLSLGVYIIFAKEENRYRLSLLSMSALFAECLLLVQVSGGIKSITVAILFLSVMVLGAFGQAVLVFSGVWLIGFFIASRPEVLTNINEIGYYDIIFIAFGLLSLFLSNLIWRERYQFFAKPKIPKEYIEKRISPIMLIESIKDGIVVIDNKGYIVEFNPASRTLVGWDINDAKGLNFKSVFKFVNSDGTKSEAIDPITQALNENRPINNKQITIKNRSSGDLIELSVSVAPFDTDIGSSAVAVMRDVSEQNKQHRQKAEFISTASHEMRTPVAAIEGYISLALNPKISVIDDKARNYLRQAHEATIHLGQLFRDLLTASKSEDGRLENHPQLIELGEFLKKLSADIRFGAEKKGISLTYSGDSNTENPVVPLQYVMVDPERLREVITNLIDNAIKFTKEGGINVSLRGDDEHVKITISDTGIGMPEEDINHLFQKFYRIDNTATRQIGGTGLGLFICKQIIELYNGRIWAESEFGKGSSFFIELPRLDQTKVNQIGDTSSVDQPQPSTQTSTTAELSSPPISPEVNTPASQPPTQTADKDGTQVQDPPQA